MVGCIEIDRGVEAGGCLAFDDAASVEVDDLDARARRPGSSGSRWMPDGHGWPGRSVQACWPASDRTVPELGVAPAGRRSGRCGEAPVRRGASSIALSGTTVGARHLPSVSSIRSWSSPPARDDSRTPARQCGGSAEHLAMRCRRDARSARRPTDVPPPGVDSRDVAVRPPDCLPLRVARAGRVRGHGDGLGGHAICGSAGPSPSSCSARNTAED